MSNIRTNIERILERIEKACNRANRNPEEVTLLMVTKTVEPQRIREALAFRPFPVGENRVQEAKSKLQFLKDMKPDWHLIGQLQTNKVKDAIQFATMIQSVDRINLVDELQKRLEPLDYSMDILIQVNTSAETSKSGVAPKDALQLIEYAAGQSKLNVKGLMTIGPLTDDQQAIRKSFRLLKEIGEKASSQISGMKVYSMGMSADMEIAIEEGSTMIRVGSAIFGHRN